MLQQLEIKHTQRSKVFKKNKNEVSIEAKAIAREPIEMRHKWYAKDGELRTAWEITLREKANTNWWNITADAVTGKIISQINYTITCPWDADSHSTSQFNKVIEDEKPHKTNVTGESYLVYALPLESPHQGGRTWVTNPFDSIASPFGICPQSVFKKSSVWYVTLGLL